MYWYFYYLLIPNSYQALHNAMTFVWQAQFMYKYIDYVCTQIIIAKKITQINCFVERKIEKEVHY